MDWTAPQNQILHFYTLLAINGPKMVEMAQEPNKGLIPDSTYHKGPNAPSL